MANLRAVLDVQEDVRFARFAQAVVRSAGVAAGVLQRDALQRVRERDSDEAVVARPADVAHARLGVHVALEGGRAVALHPQGILRSDLHPGDVCKPSNVIIPGFDVVVCLLTKCNVL